jgi:hypothetical protein
MNYGGVQKWIPDALLGGIPCSFIGTRAQFIMHGSRAYLYHIFGQGFSWRAHKQLALNAHMSIGAPRDALSTMATTWSHNGGGRANLCLRIDAHP